MEIKLFAETLLKMLVELFIWSGLAGLLALLIYVPQVHAMPLGFITLSAVSMTMFAVASLYGRFISFYEPPVGKRLVRLFVKKYH
jgi:uncharacterized RDD family membrane protein YckC